MGNKEWNICHISGDIAACDPGCNSYSHYPKSYQREELKVGMNLCRYNENLPTISVTKIMPEYIEVTCSGKEYKLSIGDKLKTPKKGLSYAYSEAEVWLE